MPKRTDSRVGGTVDIRKLKKVALRHRSIGAIAIKRKKKRMERQKQEKKQTTTAKMTLTTPLMTIKLTTSTMMLTTNKTTTTTATNTTLSTQKHILASALCIPFMRSAFHLGPES